MNSPNLQTNLVYHIVNISQRLRGKYDDKKSGKHEATFLSHIQNNRIVG